MSEESIVSIYEVKVSGKRGKGTSVDFWKPSVEDTEKRYKAESTHEEVITVDSAKRVCRNFDNSARGKAWNDECINILK